ncbi:MAG: site-specific integrase [Planctomycetes bacterium]|nr:site-specific integrase [Planctomycetota bacterium]
MTAEQVKARKARSTCVLSDHRRVKFTLKRRKGDPHYFAVFAAPVNPKRRLERSTGEAKAEPAHDAAIEIIRDTYTPKTSQIALGWEETKPRLRAAMEATNLRPATVDDYLDTLNTVQKFFPGTRGAGDITSLMAKSFKATYHATTYVRAKVRPQKVWKGRGRKPKPRPEPVARKRKPDTIASRLHKLQCLWSKWLIGELGAATANPWVDVEPPKLDNKTPRVLSAEEIRDFFAWLTARWNGWRMPILLCTVKAYIGNRILELCSLKSNQLRDGRIVFPAGGVKGRKERRALPEEVYKELKALAGPTYLWEAYPQQLKTALRMGEKPDWKVLPDFNPERLKGWLQAQIADYCNAHLNLTRFSAHAFRKTARTQAWRLGIPVEQAAIAFGCNPTTMKKHYIALDETEISDDVFKKLAEDRRGV